MPHNVQSHVSNLLQIDSPNDCARTLPHDVCHTMSNFLFKIASNRQSKLFCNNSATRMLPHHVQILVSNLLQIDSPNYCAKMRPHELCHTMSKVMYQICFKLKVQIIVQEFYHKNSATPCPSSCFKFASNR